MAIIFNHSIAHLQSNQLMEEEIKMIREEMEQIKSHSIQVSQELVETQSARDSLLLQLTQERPTEAHPLIQQYAQQIQDLKLEVTETRGKLNALCLEPSSPPTYPHYRITSSSLSTGRKKRPIIQRMRTSSFKKHPKVDPLRLIDKSTDETVAPISHGIPLEEKTELDPVLSIMPSTSLYHDELEALAVPSWSDMPKTSSVASSKRKSISLDSMWDDTDSSITTSRVDLTINEGQPHKSKSTALNEHKLKRQNKSLLKMLHQIQADLLVKRELVGQLERSEDQFSQLRTNYEERLTELREHLMETQRQRDDALEKASVRPPGLRENREAQEVRSQFEVKLKRLVSENQELKRKQAELTKTIQTARSKAEAAIQRLKSENDSLKSDRKQLNRALKHEIDRARDAAAADEREIQQLKRRLVLALDAKTKAEETVEAQHQVLRKRTEETSAAHLQLRQLTNALRKAANEGTFLNEAALDRIMEYAQTSKSNIRTTKQTRTRASSFASEP
ncbi:hypothetical protein A0J61_00982 [Choanephora cucurbitarum]|uniref:Uncharacterized protein n=1 Tax=Choanephora cucurbitarum TaxID=101091 RepID=A0A1C7NPQ3_9FUNG|nr:hypothetical protein A0J61_00982 [Choanephora cucurbitarum]